jgi:hypothetical protein
MKAYHLYVPSPDGSETIHHFTKFDLAVEFARTFYPECILLPEDEMPTNPYSSNILSISEIEILDRVPGAYINYLVRYDSHDSDFIITWDLCTEHNFDTYDYNDQKGKSYWSIYEKVYNLENLENRKSEILAEFKSQFNNPVKLYLKTNNGYIYRPDIVDNGNYELKYENGFLYIGSDNNIIFSSIRDKQLGELINKTNENYVSFYINKITKKIIHSEKTVLCECYEDGTISEIDEADYFY